MPADGHHLYNVTVITDEKRFESLKGAMEAIGITGMTITRALGFGIENTKHCRTIRLSKIVHRRSFVAVRKSLPCEGEGDHAKRITKRARRLTRQPFFWYNRRGIFFSRGVHYGY